MRRPIAPVLLLAVAAVARGSAPARAADAPAGGRRVAYRHGDVEHVGHMARPASVPAGGASGVLVVHDWTGLGDFPKARADALAAAGHVAFALDMYGGGKVASGPEEAARLAGAVYADVPAMVARAKAGLEVLRKEPGVDPRRLAAIGFCFGGSVALQLARSGEDLAGVVSFHGRLETKAPAEPGALRAKVLVLHGGLDPFVPPSQVAAFIDEMNRAKATWRMEVYGGAVHAFTLPAAGDDPSKGAAYDADADRRSQAAQDAFFAEVLARP